MSWLSTTICGDGSCVRSDCEALFEVPNLQERARIWTAETGREVAVRIGDLDSWDFISSVFAEFRPDTIIHYAEQPSAPYSMLDRQAARLTLDNNLGVTFNTIQAMAEYAPDAHLVKLGTMGEYGTPNIDIEEGWIDIEHKGRTGKFLFPRAAGSLYHTTKVLDTDLLWFYVRTWGLRVTDLMQGPVYGLATDEKRRRRPALFLPELRRGIRHSAEPVHGAGGCGLPLTVYGKGGQTRGYLQSQRCAAMRAVGS